MKKIYRYFHKLSFLLAILAIWSLLSAVVLIAVDIQTSLAAIALLIFILMISITRPFPLSSWLSLLVGSVAYAVISYSIYGISQNLIKTVGIVFVFYLVTTLLADLLSRQMDSLQKEIEKSQELVDDLVQYDQSTGIMRWKYAQQKLTAEVVRSVRYKADMSLVLIQLIMPDMANISEQELLRLKSQVVEVLLNGIRSDVDIPFIGGKFGLILPETSSEGAQILMGRLADRIFRKVRIEVAAGIASIPDDAVTVAELVNFADTALQFALNTSQTVVPAARLRANVEEQSAEEGADEEQVENVETDPFSTPLGKDEWLLEFLDFKTMNALTDLEKKIVSAGDIKDFQFISLDDTRLTVKITTSEQSLVKKLEDVPQFSVIGVDADKHIIRLLMESEG